VWRLLRNRRSTKDNLVRCGIIVDGSYLCVASCDFNESTYHLLLHCPIFGTVWMLVNDWINVSSANPFHINDHFTQFTYSTEIQNDDDHFCN
jgi:hypothetical protein